MKDKVKQTVHQTKVDIKQENGKARSSVIKGKKKETEAMPCRPVFTG
jgi:translation initiation factor IF-1